MLRHLPELGEGVLVPVKIGHGDCARTLGEPNFFGNQGATRRSFGVLTKVPTYLGALLPYDAGWVPT